MNPISTAAIFLSLTGGEKPENNKKIASKVAKLGFVIWDFSL
jgi:small neutral amino acid transporter SnatA (MarC family)